MNKNLAEYTATSWDDLDVDKIKRKLWLNI